MDLSVCLKALGDPTRFRIFQQLLVRKHCTRSLARTLWISEAAVSQHLKVLYEAGLVNKEKYGYHMHYHPVQEAMDFLAESFQEMSRASLALERDPKDCQCEFRNQMENLTAEKIIYKEQNTMRIAVTYDNGKVFQHFGHTEQFKLFDVQDGAVKSAEVVNTNGFGHSALAGFLSQQQADALICGGIGGGAQMALAEAGIRLYAGVDGDADDAMNALLAGTLNYEEKPACSHHGEHHHGCHHDEQNGDGHDEEHHCGCHDGEHHHCNGHHHDDHKCGNEGHCCH